MNKILNLLALVLSTNLAMADGNITINSSAPSDDPSIVMQVGQKRFNFKNLNLFSTKTIMKKMSQENTLMTIQIYLLILKEKFVCSRKSNGYFVSIQKRISRI